MTLRNTPRLCFIGFGEAGQALAAGLRETGVETIAAWDILFPVDGGRKLREAGERIGVRLADSAADAARGSDIVISAVTAASSLEAAQSVKPHLHGQLYLDINSVSPGRKQATAEHLDGRGALRRRRRHGPGASGAPPDAVSARRTARRRGRADSPRSFHESIGGRSRRSAPPRRSRWCAASW